jgi:hypothetical protein
MPARSSARPPEARSRHGFTFIPVRHGPLPERDTHSEQGDLRHLLSAAVMTLAAEYPDGLARRGTVAVLAAATGVLLLTVTVTVWGRAWTAVAAALARGRCRALDRRLADHPRDGTRPNRQPAASHRAGRLRSPHLASTRPYDLVSRRHQHHCDQDTKEQQA